MKSLDNWITKYYFLIKTFCIKKIVKLTADFKKCIKKNLYF